MTRAPMMGVSEVKLPALLVVKFDRQTADQSTDERTDRPGHREVTRPITDACHMGRWTGKCCRG